ncbi:glycosyltransferase [Proteus vulgaris]|uniref:glycosyltransferase family 2 protein n=1 Tax=Proteus vulgaris TaxID=585 RepID=UPI000DFAB0B5|nr:glycosyltransferase family 2 protein [Proteus vulgaris]SUC24862.1 glycosyltransferase [Proteus vulgaris]
MKKLSIIVNIKDLEHVISRCLESIEASLEFYPNSEYEILMIDDNSTDNTPEILKSFERKNPSFKYIRTTFCNLGKARKYAITQCTGDYITFIDGDDFIATVDFSKLTPILDKQPDIIITGLNEVFKKDDEIIKITLGAPLFLNRNQAITDFLIHKKYQAHLCGKFFKSEILKSIDYPEVYCYEDAFAFPDILNKSNSIVYLEEKFYNYIKDDNSLSNSINTKKTDLMTEVILKMYQVFPNNFYNLISCHAIEHLLKYNTQLSNSNRLKNQIEKIKTLNFLFDFNIRTSFKKKYLLYKIKFN